MTPSRADELADSLAALKARVGRAAATVGRDVAEIELLPVTKFFPVSDIAELVRLECREFGESREQEASKKVADVSDANPTMALRWHMIGSVQRKKARAVAGWAYAVHSVDSGALVEALGRAATQALADGRRPEPLRVYLQLNLDGDPARGGVDVNRPNLVDELCGLADAADGLDFVGLMAIPPLNADAERSFVRLASEQRRVQTFYQQRLGLSAGMSNDLEMAIKHGSTCVRVGTALMGRRPLTSP